MLMAALGLLTAFLPEFLKWINKRTDNAHEIEMFKLQMQGQEQMHRDRLEEINVSADITESIKLHEPVPAYGIPFLDKMHDVGYSQWLMVPLLYVYTALDFLQIFVRPGITLALTAFYMATKYAMYQNVSHVYDGEEWYKAILAIYTDYDRDLLTLVLSYWFGSRLAGKAFSSKQPTGFR